MQSKSKEIEATKWCIALLAYGVLIYFFVTWVIPVGLLVFLTWNDYHFTI